MNTQSKTDKTVTANQNCAQTMSDASYEELERWVATTLLNDEASSDSELIEHFMQGDEVPYEQAKFYVDQRNRALREGLTFTLESYEPQHSPLPWRTFTRYILSNGRFLATAHAIGDQSASSKGFAVGQEPTQDMNEAEANAKLIVASVNHAEALAEALREAYNFLPTTEGNWGLTEREAKLANTIKQALANWEGAK